MTDRLEVKKSIIPNAGNGLFSKKIIPKGTIVCEYSGSKMKKSDSFALYCKNPKDYLNHIHPFIRDLNDDEVIVGNTNIPKSGVFVNDAFCLRNIGQKDIKHYNNISRKNANVTTVVLDDKLLYMSTKKIKKGEEIYTSYGAGYWLLQLGVPPQDILLYKL